MKISRKEARQELSQFHLACELAKLIRHFFPELLSLLKKVENKRHQSYITYSGHVLLMKRSLSSLFYISSMRKTSEEFNSDVVIEKIAFLCKEPELVELPYWETINDYLKKVEPKELQEVIWNLVKYLLRCRGLKMLGLEESIGKSW